LTFLKYLLQIYTSNLFSKMAKVFFVIGGNLGNREWYIEETARLISERIGHITKRSGIYESEPWGLNGSINFLNQVIIAETCLSPAAILLEISFIENSLGRIRGNDGYISRTVDIDILFYDHEVILSPNIVIPHKSMHQRRFVLMPLVEVEPDFIHPLFSVTIRELLATCSDSGRVWSYKPEAISIG